MRRFLLILLLLGAWLAPSQADAQTKPKNVVLVIADDLGREVGCYGAPVIKTPNLDALAKRGVKFVNAYATVSSCSPSRASMFTGLYTHQNGMYGLQHAAHKQECFAWVQGLPNLLRAAGYYTGLVGKYHVGPDSSFNFDRLITKTKGRDVDYLAQQSRDFIKGRGNKPFFLIHAFADPHRAGVGFGNQQFTKDPREVKYDPKDVIVPYHLPDCEAVRKDLAEYYQSVSRMDRGVGALIEVLRELGELDNTLILFVSDNGIPFPGAKTTLYNSGINLPLIVAGPGLPEGRTNHALVNFVDLAPTILDWTKAAGPKYKLPGRSFLPILGEDHPKGWDTTYASHQWHEVTMYYPMRSIITPKYKLIVNLDYQKDYPHPSDLWGSPSWQHIRKTGEKMMGQRSVAAFLHRPKEELYDLTSDPNELRNLAGDPALAETLAGLRQRLRAWQAATNDPWLINYREENQSFNK
jgi:N-sulfoglucosamine sulfohydrolase